MSTVVHGTLLCTSLCDRAFSRRPFLVLGKIHGAFSDAGFQAEVLAAIAALEGVPAELRADLRDDLQNLDGEAPASGPLIAAAVHQQLRRVPCPSLIGNVSVLMEFAVPLLVDAGFGPTMVQEKVRGL